MSARGDVLAQEYDVVLADVLAFCESCSDETWSTPTAEEGWPVGAVAHHIALAAEKLTVWTQQICAGEAAGEPAQTIDDWNASESARFGERSRADTLALLRDTAVQARQLLRTLSDEQLDRTAVFMTTGKPRSGEEMARRLRGHMQTHLEHMRSAAEVAESTSTQAYEKTIG